MPTEIVTMSYTTENDPDIHHYVNHHQFNSRSDYLRTCIRYYEKNQTDIEKNGDSRVVALLLEILGMLKNGIVLQNTISAVDEIDETDEVFESLKRQMESNNE